MSIDRRKFLKVTGTGIAATTLATGALPALGREHKEAPADAVGMLYDSTRCIGCRACVSACSKANDLPAQPRPVGPSPDDLEFDADLNGEVKTVITMLDRGEEHTFMKKQCMHCLDPACASACMMGAYQKRDHGIVTWEANRCIGCRMCQMVCPFNIPKFEWEKAIPKLVKCEMCVHRIREGGQPACTDVCPRDAVIYGPWRELLADAKARLEAYPDRYEQHVYGEHEAGGTQVLYLSPKGVPFEQLSLPDISDEAIPRLTETVQHGVYKGFIAPVALYAALGIVLFKHRRTNARKTDSGEEQS